MTNLVETASMGWPLTEFTTAFVAGAVVICVFAWDQFNRPSYGQAKELARMLELLTPADIRSWHVFLRAYAVYALLLLVIYAVLCLAGEGAVRQVVVPGSNGWGEDGMTPLSVSLIMVGLIPNAGIKGFSTIEAKLRRLAHRSVGIPSSVFSRRDIMAGISLRLDDLGDAVIGAGERRRIAERLKDARTGLGRGEAGRVARLEQALVKIVAYRSWVLDHAVFPTEMLRLRFARVEQEIEREIGALDVELDILAAASRLKALDPADGQVVAELLTAGPRLADEATRRHAMAERWQAAVTSSERIAKQVCALMMLYLERSSDLPQGDEAAESLGRYLTRVRERERSATEDFDLVAIVAVVAVGAMALGGVGAHLLHIVEGHSVLVTSVNYAATAALTYGLAMLVAARRRSQAIEAGRWSSTVGAWPPRVLPVARIALIAGAWSMVSLIAYNLVSSLLTPGADWARFVQMMGPAVMEAARTEAPRLLLATIQAAFFLVALDAGAAGAVWQDAQAPTKRLPAIHAVALFVGAALIYQHRASGGGAPAEWYALLYAGSLAATIGWLTSFVALRLPRWPEPPEGNAVAAV